MTTDMTEKARERAREILFKAIMNADGSKKAINVAVTELTQALSDAHQQGWEECALAGKEECLAIRDQIISRARSLMNVPNGSTTAERCAHRVGTLTPKGEPAGDG